MKKKEAHRTVRCASPTFIPIARLLSFTNRKRKYVEEKTTATVKNKQTSIATVRNHILTVACFLTPLRFHYPLPLNYCNKNVSFALLKGWNVIKTSFDERQWRNPVSGLSQIHLDQSDLSRNSGPWSFYFSE
jgi:hypothetical protein